MVTLTFFRFWEWIWPSSPALSTTSLVGAKKERRINRDLAKLYILRVDFPVTNEQRAIIKAGLDPLREQYGIDFFLLEPGIHLSRFDDI
jgi:hypothetical protein